MPTPKRSLDDLPLAAYLGSAMEHEAEPRNEPAAPEQPTAVTGTTAAESASAAAPPSALPGADLPVPEDEPSHGTSQLARVIRLFRTSRLAAGAGFAVVIVFGLILLSGGGASPNATAATPTGGPAAAPTVVPPSGDAELALSGAVTGTFPLAGLPGGQRVDATSLGGGWGDTTAQTTLSIAGPLDRGTRATDEHLVLTIGVLVGGEPVTFTSLAGECTIGMAYVGTKVQGSFTCHKLKSPDGKLSIDASGSYRT